MAIKIDLAKAKELISLAVAERGEDYVYPHSECQNVWNAGELYGPYVYTYETHEDNWVPEENAYVYDKDQPGCIVGLAMFKAGFPLDQIDVDGGVGELDDSLPEGTLTYAAKAYLEEAQINQDRHESWGTAKARADSMANHPSFTYSDKFWE